MIEVHHLNNSRSQRILWLLEELKTILEKDVKNILDTMNRSGAPYTLNRIPKLDD